MKRLLLIFVPFFQVVLSSCSSQSPVQPAITTGALDSAEAYLMRGDRYSEIRDFNRAIQLQPDFPQAYSNRGNAFYRAGRIDLAMNDFYHAGKIPGFFTTILCGLSIVVVILIFVAIPLRLRQAKGMRVGYQAVIDKIRTN